MIITVRAVLLSGTGGSGAAAFIPTKSSLHGPPCGGSGGQGSSIYLTTSPHLTSLSSVPSRIRGGPGGNGQGSFRNGRKGEEMVLSVPVGTVVRELGRVGEEERRARDDSAEGVGEEEVRKRRRERWFLGHPSGESGDVEFEDAEKILYREGRIPSSRTLSLLSSPSPPSSSMLPPTEPPIDLDLSHPLPQPILLAPGGLGGLGNPHFVTATTRAPRLASRGVVPPLITLSLELKLLADVGLVGFPNAGKSTLLRGLTGRRAEVGEWRFTTVNPQVGVVRLLEGGGWVGGFGRGEGDGVVEETWREREKERGVLESGEYVPVERQEGGNGVEKMRFTISDNPGLLPLAHQNVGLGHSFLRSIERSLALVYVLDLTREDPAADLEVLRGELEEYKKGLGGKGWGVVVNKGDGVEEGVGRERVAKVTELVKSWAREESGMEGTAAGSGRELEVFVVSGKYGLGLGKVVERLGRFVEEAREVERRKEEENDEGMGDD